MKSFFLPSIQPDGTTILTSNKRLRGADDLPPSSEDSSAVESDTAYCQLRDEERGASSKVSKDSAKEGVKPGISRKTE